MPKALRIIGYNVIVLSLIGGIWFIQGIDSATLAAARRDIATVIIATCSGGLVGALFLVLGRIVELLEVPQIKR